ncbi:MAG: hypothetical protein U0X75_29870 [Acidobacteriota bacterium]
MLNRVKELAPLGLQVREHDLRLREWRNKYAALVTRKDDEVKALESRCRVLAPLPARLAAVEAQLQEEEAAKQAALQDKKGVS